MLATAYELFSLLRKYPDIQSHIQRLAYEQYSIAQSLSEESLANLFFDISEHDCYRQIDGVDKALSDLSDHMKSVAKEMGLPLQTTSDQKQLLEPVQYPHHNATIQPKEDLKQIPMRKTYPSDVSREQFEIIRPILESARKQTRPRTLDLYEVFCAVLYLLKSGCQWRMLPSDFPKWRSVHAYFQIWSEARENEPTILEQSLKKIGWRGPYAQWSDQDHQFLHH